VAGEKSKKDSVSKDHPSFDALTKKQKAVAQHIEPILRASGLRDPKLTDIKVLVAIRNFKSTEDAAHYTLAALASAYADTSAMNKNSVAAHRIEKNTVSADFIADPGIWRSLPVTVLQAAGIADLQSYVRQLKYANSNNNED
jgi:hypothetical protein